MTTTLICLLVAITCANPSFAAVNHFDLVAIPSGKYWIGCDDSKDKECSGAEKPGSMVVVAGFKISKFEITQGDYNTCFKAGRCQKPGKGFDPGKTPRFPVTAVSWSQADQFCRWTKMRLPTEVEWEVAAKGDDNRIYPWGDQSPDCKTANSLYQCNTGVKPVGSFPKDVSPFGVYDMNGNVEEWVNDGYDLNALNKLKGIFLGEVGHNFEKTVRGGSYISDRWHSRNTHRFYAPPNLSSNERGFRCVASQ